MISEEVLKERQRCEQLILNVIKHNPDKTALVCKLKLILQKVRTGANGGRSSGQQARP